MPEWATFAGFALVVTSGLLLLSHATRSALEPGTDIAESSADVDDGRDPTDRETITLPKSGVEVRPADVRRPAEDRVDDARDEDDRREAGSEPPDLSTASLLANVAVSQGLFGALLLAGAWYAEIPARAFGVAPETVGVEAVALGVGLGIALYAANEVGSAVGGRFDLGDGDRLRSALAPDGPLGWAALLLVVLPVIAAFEELLFRGALVGVIATGYDVSPWAMAVVSSGAFALGHGAQGRLGMLVTGALGFVLAAAFVATGSLLVVVVAHYLVNALEFAVHEGLGVEWSPGG